MNFKWHSGWRSIASTLTTALLVVACGGGSGGGDSVVPTSVPTTSVPVTLLAGSLQRAGSMDGTGLEAQFFQPRALAVDRAGTIYVADSGNATIRKIDPKGVVTTFAGMAGQSGSADGAGSAARFYGPSAVAVDRDGYVYVGDSSNGVIRKISPQGIVTTLAGTAGQHGAVDGLGPAARFFSPSGIALDSVGNLFVADSGHAVRKVAPDGNVTTFAGKLGESAFVVADGDQARFEGVSAVAVDAQDRVYVFENRRLRRFDSAGHALPWGGAPQGVVALDTSVCRIGQGIAVAPNGDLIVACSEHAFRITIPPDQLHMQVLRIAPAGTISVVAGQGSGNIDGPAAVARFNDPWGVAVRSDGNILVSEVGNHAIRQIDTQGVVSTLAGGTGEGFADGHGPAARFSNPSAIVTAPDGNLYVADGDNGQVRRVSFSGDVSTLTMVAEDGTALSAGAGMVFSMAVATDGRVYLSYVSRSSSSPATGIGILDAPGRYRVLISGTQPYLPPPYTMAALGAGVCYPVSIGPGVYGIEQLLSDGTRKIIATGFTYPGAIAVDASGIVYVADLLDHTVRAVDAQGTVRLVAGKPGEAGYVDGNGEQARLNRPSSLTVDDTGNLYVADATGTVRKITKDGQVSTVGGPPGSLNGIKGLAWRAGMIYATVVNAVIAIGPVN